MIWVLIPFFVRSLKLQSSTGQINWSFRWISTWSLILAMSLFMCPQTMHVKSSGDRDLMYFSDFFFATWIWLSNSLVFFSFIKIMSISILWIRLIVILHFYTSLTILQIRYHAKIGCYYFKFHDFVVSNTCIIKVGLDSDLQQSYKGPSSLRKDHKRT